MEEWRKTKPRCAFYAAVVKWGYKRKAAEKRKAKERDSDEYI